MASVKICPRAEQILTYAEHSHYIPCCAQLYVISSKTATEKTAAKAFALAAVFLFLAHYIPNFFIASNTRLKPATLAPIT